ncbi:pentatricopeptide repeat-containing protein At1g08070, chloroplastic-like [Gastrolobium bilobum]|uniref:pentatricopeptide repeat-containing protein At1g08070, chloroplastic-like n=1 Tax=Gastrolobium bilobum TaxID=150636 RepID=UPI002AB1E09C|nr:pentatricopeptide repeat-containing protein At1g08070, chloroplastic-like [Gastrolobium bilobum]
MTSSSVSVPLSVTTVGANPTTTLLLLAKCSTLSQVRQIHAHIIKTNLVTHAFCVAKLINAFSRSCNPYEAVSVYTHLLSCFQDLRGIELSVPSALRACGRSCAFEEGKQIMGFVLKTHLWRDPFVSNSVVRMWLEVGEIVLARSVFDKMPVRDLISWNSLITGYLRAGEIEMAREAFEEMPQRDVVSCNAMIDGYGKHGKCELAEEVFMSMSVKDVVTWTSMISAFVLNHRPGKGLDLFREMLSLGVRPDAPAIVSVLSAIANLGFVEEGKWLHTYIYNNKIERSCSFIGSALINMYAKCGQIDNAYNVFRSICHRRNVGDWNSMISGLGLHGLGHEAIKVFLDLERAELKPDDITFLGLLSACNHGGLMDEGQFYFETMQVKYKIAPKIQHYGCIIDLLGRAGRLEEALGVIHDMPLEPDVLIWKAILSASMKHNNVVMGHNAALRAIELAPEDSSCYVLLSNIYAKAGRWDDVTKFRSLMKKRGVRKVPGCSSILVDGIVHEFLVGKVMDVGYNQHVLSKLEEVVSKLKSEGYEPDLNQVFLDIEDHEKESHLTLHSEKMALAFGLSTIPQGIPIHIVKNLRICCDCHTFMQMVSKIYNRRIIVRDQNRFHHFDKGCCSCRNHW